MKTRTLIIAVAAALSAVSCARVSAVTRISGNVEGEGLDKVNVIVPQMELDTIVPVEDGKFSIEIPSDVKAVGTIESGNLGVQFIPDGTNLNVKLAEGECVVKSAVNHVQRKFEEYQEEISGFQKKLNAELDAIKEDVSLAAEEADAKMEEVYSVIENEFKEMNLQLLSGNKDNILGVMALQQVSGIVSDEELGDLIESLSDQISENENVVSIKAGLDARRGTSEGMMFTDFTIEDSDGKTVKFSDFVGNGKYVLVDFWASWCGPCKREIPNIANVYEKYHGDNFDVLSVAVWDAPEATKKAAEEHGVVWQQIINAQTIPTEIYGIEGIPHIMLIGPDGTILKRDLRGEAIEATVSEYLKAL